MTPIRLFMVEDDWMCREALQSVIQQAAFIEMVGSAADGEKALSRIPLLQPDVVLMDIRLSGEISGIDATALLTRACPQVKVIILTNSQDEERLHAAIQAGAAGFLLKSEIHDPAVILRAIREVNCGKGYMTPSVAAKVLAALKNTRRFNDHELTRREVEILGHLGEGKSNRGIAEQLGIHERTVANHVSNILYKINAKNRTEAVAIARKTGLVTGKTP